MVPVLGRGAAMATSRDLAIAVHGAGRTIACWHLDWHSAFGIGYQLRFLVWRELSQ